MGMYEPQSINQKDKQILATLRRNSEKNLLRMEEDLGTMLAAVRTYREALADSLDLNVEEADIVCKYATKPTMGSYNLPSVLVGTRANYDMGEIKEDNERLENLKKMSEDARKQSNAYYDILYGAYTDLTSEIKKSKLFSANIEQAINILRDGR